MMLSINQITENFNACDEIKSNCFNLKPAEPENTINTKAINEITATNSLGNVKITFPPLFIFPRRIPAMSNNNRLGR